MIYIFKTIEIYSSIINDTKYFFNQVNDLEKIQQENITLKADSIIYREDISSLVELNNKYSQDLEIARRKILDLIYKNNSQRLIALTEYYVGYLPYVIQSGFFFFLAFEEMYYCSVVLDRVLKAK